MPLRLDIKKRLLSRSDRVKCVDIHPTEPWICSALYNGHVHIWNIEAQQRIKTIEVTNTPVRAVKFVARMNWIITGSDDLQLRVFNYNTLERVHQSEAHSDYIRSIAVHPTQPFVLTSSDDMHIRLWDWEKNWTCAQVFEGHSHYVMQLVFNPKDNNTFASASLDRTVKVWNIGSSTPNFTLEGHERGVNCVDYYIFGDKPYLASGADDRTVKIWDYQTKSCVQTLEGHAQNITSVVFHPELPIILTGSEDGTIRVWHSSTYRLESTLNYGLERIWTMVCHHGRQMVGIGYDEGTVVISLGRDEPAISMDTSGKLVCARHADLLQSNLRSLAVGPDGMDEYQDGERLPITLKDMGTSEIYPQTIMHNANGRFVVVCGDGEYIVYTAMALRNKTFGQAQEFVWSMWDASMYAIRESNTTVKVYKQFKELRTFKLDYGAEQIFGGHLLGVRSLSGLAFYDWSTGRLIRRIDTTPKLVQWNETGQLVALCTADTVFILRFSADLVSEQDAAPGSVEEVDGYEKAFEVIPNGQFSLVVRSGCWFGEAFLFTTSTNRLCYFVGGEIVTVAHLDRQMYLMGYLAKENRVFLCDRDLQIVSYTLLLSVLEYETAVMRADFAAADRILPSIPREQHTKIAQFLEKQGFRTQAMRVTTDSDHKFELALQMGDFQLCRQLAAESTDAEASEGKWKQLAEVACRSSDFELAEECLSSTKDYASLLLIASSSGNTDMLHWIAKQALAEGRDNIAFLVLFLLCDLEACLELLIRDNRLPEAAFFSRAYLPSQVPRVVELWRTWLATTSKGSSKFSQALANPKDYPNLFPGYEESLLTEKWIKADRANRSQLPASAYPLQTPIWERDPQSEMTHSEMIQGSVSPCVVNGLYDASAVEKPHHQDTRTDESSFEEVAHLDKDGSKPDVNADEDDDDDNEFYDDDEEDAFVGIEPKSEHELEHELATMNIDSDSKSASAADQPATVDKPQAWGGTSWDDDDEDDDDEDDEEEEEEDQDDK